MHPVAPVLRPVASDKIIQIPNVYTGCCTVAPEMRPWRGEEEDAETRRRGDAEIRQYRRVPPPGGSLPVRSDESKAGIDPSLSEVIRTVPNRSEP